MKKKYTVLIEKDENGVYIGEVVGLPACYTQASSFPELLSRLVEVSEGSIDILNDFETSSSPSHFNFSLEVDYA